MAKQKGFLRLLTGSMGETTFVKTKDGYRAQEKKVTTPGKFLTDPKMARTRENAAEFGAAGKAASVLLSSISSLVKTSKDNRMNARLFKEVSKVIKSDAVSPRGKRNVVDGDTSMLKDFDFNKGATLGKVFQPAFTTTLNRVTGELTLNVPAFVPNIKVQAPASATHYQIVSAGAEIDFGLNTFKSDIKVSAQLPWNGTATAVLTEVHNVTPNSTLPLFMFVGVQFFIQTNGVMYQVAEGSSSALRIVLVNKP